MEDSDVLYIIFGINFVLVIMCPFSFVVILRGSGRREIELVVLSQRQLLPGSIWGPLVGKTGARCSLPNGKHARDEKRCSIPSHAPYHIPFHDIPYHGHARWVMLFFAGILVASSLNLLMEGEEDHADSSQLENNTVLKIANWLCDSVDYYDGEKFFTLVMRVSYCLQYQYWGKGMGLLKRSKAFIIGAETSYMVHAFFFIHYSGILRSKVMLL